MICKGASHRHASNQHSVLQSFQNLTLDSRIKHRIFPITPVVPPVFPPLIPRPSDQARFMLDFAKSLPVETKNPCTPHLLRTKLLNKHVDSSHPRTDFPHTEPPEPSPPSPAHRTEAPRPRAAAMAAPSSRRRRSSSWSRTPRREARTNRIGGSNKGSTVKPRLQRNGWPKWSKRPNPKNENYSETGNVCWRTSPNRVV